MALKINAYNLAPSHLLGSKLEGQRCLGARLYTVEHLYLVVYLWNIFGTSGK